MVEYRIRGGYSRRPGGHYIGRPEGAGGYDGGPGGAAPDTRPGTYARIGATNRGGPPPLGKMDSAPNLYFGDVKIKTSLLLEVIKGWAWAISKLLHIGEIIPPLALKYMRYLGLGTSVCNCI